MKISLIVVGRTTDPHCIALINEYTSRLQHYAPFELQVIPELKNTKALRQEQQKAAEGDLILKAVSSADHVVLLDEHGKMFRSVEFASWIEQKQQMGGHGRLVFVVGGPYGFSDAVYRRAQEKISLSAMTFSHQLIRVLFVEQLYRAYTIIQHEPYHHE
jgi:23S rRNA (pseudouridine1915-N3)-methyltransferase